MLPNSLQNFAVRSHAYDLHRQARRRRAGHVPAIEDTQSHLPITIRSARSVDALAVARLAALDAGPVPAEPVLVAEVAGQIRAAMSVMSGGFISDPFTDVRGMRLLLATRAAQLRGDAPRRRSVARLLSRGRRFDVDLRRTS
jgi:hypothetical protein